jgi:hypothetical protein
VASSEAAAAAEQFRQFLVDGVKSKAPAASIEREWSSGNHRSRCTFRTIAASRSSGYFSYVQGLLALRMFWIYCSQRRFRVLKTTQDESPLKLPFVARMANAVSASHERDVPLAARVLRES